MVLSEDERKDELPLPAPTDTAESRCESWWGLLIWLAGFLFLATLAVWDMIASLFR
jgi:hypothetical protein